MGGDLRDKNKAVETEDSEKQEQHTLIPARVLRLAPLLFAFIAGVSVMWFNANYKPEPEKEENKQKIERSVPLEEIVSQKSSNVVDSARNYNAQGLLYFSQKRYAAAESSFESALELCPNYEIAICNLFNTKFVLKKFDEAISLIDRIKQAREKGYGRDLQKCYIAYAAHLLSEKRPEEAEKRIEHYFGLNPQGDAFGEGANLYLKIAGFYFAREDYKNSVRVGERLLEIVPLECKKEHARLHSNLAISYYGLAEKKRDLRYLRLTEEHIHQARELDPDNGQIRDISERCALLFKSIEASKK